jgi:hypothetical protein
MSSLTWTAEELSSKFKILNGQCWRVVEAQNKCSTLKLVDSLDEQAILEGLIDATKPPVPVTCQHLHFLLSTPFRYDAAYPNGSRFRRAGRTAGVFYAGETVATAVAELAFYRLLFFSESPSTPLPTNPGDYTAFSVDYSTEHGVDLTQPPLNQQAALWMHPTNYGPCQGFSDAARAAGGLAIRYTSIRDPKKGANLALLDCAVFVQPAPTGWQTWRLFVRRDSVQALCEFPRQSLEFAKAAFNDPRLS